MNSVSAQADDRVVCLPMHRIALIMAFAIVYSANLFAQQTPPENGKAACSFSELFRKEGWTVPGLAGAEIKIPRAAVRNIPGVSVTMLKPADTDSNLTLEKCSQDHLGRIEIVEDAPIKIIDLWAFDAGGKTFAYRLLYACETVDHGKRHELACATSIFSTIWTARANLQSCDIPIGKVRLLLPPTCRM